MYSWIPICLVLFATLPPRRALLAVFLGGWLFLPVYNYDVPGLPDYNKITATAWGALIGVLLFNSQRLRNFKLHPLDFPMVIWCLCPFFSSVSNDLGVWDGLSGVIASVLTWGVPYLLGRVYFRTIQDFRELATAIFISGLIYAPLCLYEWRMSPQLHRMVYGEHQHEFQQTYRAIGYRPMVFLSHGLVLSMWMMVSTLCGYWLWQRAFLRYIGPVPMWICLSIVTAATLLTQSVNALFLLTVGLVILWAPLKLRITAPLICLMLVAPGYVYVRTLTDTNPMPLVRLVEKTISAERARSLQTRFVNEEILLTKARERPANGWGRWGRSRVLNDYGEDISKTDGMWIIALGETGFVGLFALMLVYAMPLLIFWKRYPASSWRLHTTAPVAVIAIVIGLYSIDNLFNSAITPILVMSMGAVANVTRPDEVKVVRSIRGMPPKKWKSRFV